MTAGGKRTARARLRPRQAAAVLLPQRFAIRAGFPAVLAVLAYLLMLVAAAGTLGAAQLLRWHEALFDRLVIELMPAEEGAHSQAAALAERLRAVPGVEAVAIVDAERLRRLAAPWLGEQAGRDGVPLPRLIEVTIRDAAARARVAEAIADWPGKPVLFAPDAAIAGLAARIRMAIAVGIGAGLLMLGATVLLVIFAVQAEFASHLDTLSLARALGADDAVILGAFAHRFADLAGRGAFAALVLFVVTAVAFLYAAGQGWSGDALRPWGWFVLAAPVATALLLVVTVRRVAWVSARVALGKLA